MIPDNSQNELENKLTYAFYEDYYVYAGWRSTDWKQWAKAEKLDIDTVSEAVAALAKNLIIQNTGEFEAKMTTYGVLFAEKSGVVADDIVRGNKRSRRLILQALFDLKEQDSPVITVQRELILRTAGLSSEDFDRQRAILLEKEHMFRTVNGTYRLTESGEEHIKTKEGSREARNRYVELAADVRNPHGRALRLGSLLCEVAEAEGWDVLPNIPDKYREYDLIATKDESSYVIECTWGDERLRPTHVVPLRKHVDASTNRWGIMVSMSGFALETIRETVHSAASSPVLLFGPQDIDHLMNGRTDLGELIARKRDSLETKRLAVVDGRAVSL